MERSFCWALIGATWLCAACSHHQQLRDVETTTTSATIRGSHTLEPGAAADVADVSAPTALVATMPDDARIAAAVEAYDDAAVARANVAIARATDSRVRDYAELVRDRHRNAKLRLSNVTVAPDVAPRATLADEGSATRDFDRAYVAIEAREQSALLQLLDSSTPETKTMELRKRLIDLRPQVADLWVRGYELQQILAAP